VPHGKDPVLYGIRGESPEWVERSATQLQSESPAFSQIWRTNQGTDAHLLFYDGEPLDGSSYHMDGIVTAAPVTGRGGHVSFVLRPDVGGKTITAFAFEPTKEFRHAVRRLLPGDRVTLCGSWQKNSLRLEKFRLNTLALAVIRKSPKCPVCGGRMTSAGREKGYKCRSCSERIRKIATLPREITKSWYEVPPGARRHLTKPIVRMRDI
jgi:tRNA(Ile2)-agmatinylcytidine synthase